MTDPFQVPPTGPVPLAPPSSAGSFPPVPGPPPMASPPLGLEISPESPSSRPRSRGKLIGGLVAATALVAAGTFAVVQVTGNDDQGGAASPVEVGDQLIGALEQQDLLGVIDLLLPGERETFREPFTRLVDHLKRLEVLDGSASAGSVGGVDLAFTDVVVEEHSTNVDDISTIVIDGNISAGVDGEAVPLGSLLLDDVFDGDRPDMDQQTDEQPFEGIELAVVNDGGRWYLSAFYSLAEQLRGDTDIPDEPLASVGADSPEGAVDDLLDAVSRLDVTAALQVLDPTEFGALLRYAPLFLDDAQITIDDADITWGITDTEYTVEGSGDRRSIGIDSLTFTLTDPGSGESKQLTYSDGCIGGDLFGDEPVCADDSNGGSAIAGDLIEQFGIGDGEALQAVLDDVTEATADYDPSGLAVHQVDGKWFVSPMRTGFDVYDAVLRAFDADELREIIDDARSFADTVDADDVLDGLVDLGSDTLEDVPLETVPFDEIPFDTDPSDPTDPTEDTVDSEFAALDACYELSDAGEAIACLNDGVADGSIDPDFVSAQYLHPECGVAEQYWSGLYSMSDADFVQMVEAASPCFLALIESGELTPYDVPGELLDPSCLEGRNWWAVFDDDEYNERFSECTNEAVSRLNG